MKSCPTNILFVFLVPFLLLLRFRLHPPFWERSVVHKELLLFQRMMEHPSAGGGLNRVLLLLLPDHLFIHYRAS